MVISENAFYRMVYRCMAYRTRIQTDSESPFFLIGIAIPFTRSVGSFSVQFTPCVSFLSNSAFNFSCNLNAIFHHGVTTAFYVYFYFVFTFQTLSNKHVFELFYNNIHRFLIIFFIFCFCSHCSQW